LEACHRDRQQRRAVARDSTRTHAMAPERPRRGSREGESMMQGAGEAVDGEQGGDAGFDFREWLQSRPRVQEACQMCRTITAPGKGGGSQEEELACDVCAAQRELFLWQFPARSEAGNLERVGDCSKRAMLVHLFDGAGWSLARQLLFLAQSLWYAHGNGRTLVTRETVPTFPRLPPPCSHSTYTRDHECEIGVRTLTRAHECVQDAWNYAGAHCTRGWQCHFEALSSCSEHDQWAVISLPLSDATHTSTQVVYVSDVERPGPFCTSYNVSGRDLVRGWAMGGVHHVPAAFRHRGACWWLAQALGFIFAPKTRDAAMDDSTTCVASDGREGNTMTCGGRGRRREMCARVCRFLDATDVVRAFGSEAMVGMGQQVRHRANLTAEAMYSLLAIDGSISGRGRQEGRERGDREADGEDGGGCDCGDRQMQLVLHLLRTYADVGHEASGVLERSCLALL
ncbi:MAG: hypothetical protein ACPIOQ_19805, partial [Promethearchaeia archaeon]